MEPRHRNQKKEGGGKSSSSLQFSSSSTGRSWSSSSSLLERFQISWSWVEHHGGVSDTLAVAVGLGVAGAELSSSVCIGRNGGSRGGD